MNDKEAGILKIKHIKIEALRCENYNNKRTIEVLKNRINENKNYFINQPTVHFMHCIWKPCKKWIYGKVHIDTK